MPFSNRSRSILQPLALLSTLLLLSSAEAQIELSLRVEPGKALLHESIIAHVDITNNSSKALEIGGQQADADLDFDIRDMNGDYVDKRRGRKPLPETTVIEPFKQRTVAVDIASCYRLAEALPYKIACKLDWRGKIYSSNQTYFDIVPGIAIASKTVAVPGGNDIVRRFSLLYMHRGNKAHIFLKIENVDETICYGVYDLGDYIRIQDAQMQVDGRGLIHILYQSGPRRFSYYVLDAHGKSNKKKFYAGTAGKIGLLRTNLGEVLVDGGEEYEGDAYTTPYEFRRNRVFE